MRPALPIALLAAALAASPLAAQHPEPPARPPLTYSLAPVDAAAAERWRQDLAALVDLLPRHHKNAFHTVTREAWQAEARRLHDRIPTLPAHAIAVELSRLVARIGDGHTSLPLYVDRAAGFHVLPLRLGIYRDGIHVEGADRAYADAVGGRVVSFNGVAADEALRRVAEIVTHESEPWIGAVAPHLLNRVEALHALGLAEGLDRATLVVEREGRRRSVVVRPLPAPGGGPMGIPFLPRYTADWVDARPADAPVPLWMQDRGGVPYFRAYVPESRIMYLQFSQTAEDAARPVAALFREACAAADSVPVEATVVDIRRNTGGEGGLVRGIVKEIVRCPKLDRPGRLFLVIGRRTFSAGQLLTNEMEKWTHAVMVGEPTGSTPNLYGNHALVTLPNSGLTFSASPAWHQTAEPYDRRPFTAPRLAAVPAFADYVRGRDPALEAIRASLGRRPLADVVTEAMERGDTAAVRRLAREHDADPVNEFADATGPVNAAGYRLLRAGRKEEAVAVFRINVELHPRYANGWDSLGEGLAEAGRHREAADAYREALRLEPTNGHAAEMLRRLGG